MRSKRLCLLAMFVSFCIADGAHAGDSDCFIRGDCDVDTTLAVTDMIFGINYILLDGDTPPCLDACDSDDSGALSIVDSLLVLAYLFNNGPPPEAPFPTAGLDPTTNDVLGCNTGLSCDGRMGKSQAVPGELLTQLTSGRGLPRPGTLPATFENRAATLVFQCRHDSTPDLSLPWANSFPISDLCLSTVRLGLLDFCPS